MKNILVCIVVMLALTACGNSANVNFKSIKVFDDRFNVALETKDVQIIKSLKSLFNKKIELKGEAPNFKYLLEFATSSGTERWRYSDQGYTMKYSQEDQRIFVITQKDEFNELLTIQ